MHFTAWLAPVFFLAMAIPASAADAVRLGELDDGSVLFLTQTEGASSLRTVYTRLTFSAAREIAGTPGVLAQVDVQSFDCVNRTQETIRTELYGNLAGDGEPLRVINFPASVRQRVAVDIRADNTVAAIFRSACGSVYLQAAPLTPTRPPTVSSSSQPAAPVTPTRPPTVPSSGQLAQPAFSPLPTAPGVFVSTRQTIDPPALPPPVDIGQSLESAMANPLPRFPGTNAQRNRATAAKEAPIIIVNGKPGECQANWTQYFVLQEFMRDFAKMSLFIYAGPRPIQRASDDLVDLEDRIRRAPIDVKYVLSLEKKSAVVSRNGLINWLARKRELATAGYRLRADMHDDFFRQSSLSEEKLEKEDFEFEIWERDGYFVVAFRGTSLPSGWISDARQILNIDVGKGLYEYADQLIKYLIKGARIDRSRIATTGHSLGGGLAVYSHLRNDTDFAIVFNPAELSWENQARAKNPLAAGRVFNYMSYVPGTDAADFVSQGSFVAKEMLKLPLMELPDGKLYGKRFYLPITVFSSEWNLAETAGIVTGVGAITPYGLSAGIVAAAESASIAPNSRVATAKTRGIETAGATAAATFWHHKVRSTILGGFFGIAAYNKVAPIENIAWGIFQMHIMNPLAAAAETRFFEPVSLTCTGPATPALVKQQVDITSRVGNFLKLADVVARAPKESTPAKQLK